VRRPPIPINGLQHHFGRAKRGLNKASHSGKVVCPVEAKWILRKTTSFLSCFQSAEPHREAHEGLCSRSAEAQLVEALETLQKAARNELEPNDPPRGRKVRRKSKP
jgi:hypothetical protein